MKNKSGHQNYIRSGMAANATAGMAILIIVASGCASQSAPTIKGRWVPVNGFAEKTEAIPLRQSYLFYPSPADKTLRTMLARWAKDSDLALTYLHPDDFTLHRPVTQIRTDNLQEAVSRLTMIYADQRISITAGERAIVVTASEQNAVFPASARNETVITK